MLHVSMILNHYLMKLFAKWFLALSFSVCTVIFIFDLIEILRRSAGKSIAFITCAHMALLKLLTLFLELIPFIVLLTSWITFFFLMKRRELIVMRTSGLSIWQALCPLLIFVLIVKIIELAALNPLASSLYAQFERTEGRYLFQKNDHIIIDANGLWIKQSDRQKEFILYAKSINEKALQDLTIFEFNDQDTFIRRLEAKEGLFTAGYLELKDATIFHTNAASEKHSQYPFDSGLTFEHIQEKSAHPKTISFWRLPELIRFLDRLKLSTQKYSLHWHKLLANIVLTMGMVILGASGLFFQLGRKKVFPILSVTIGLGFAIFFISDISYALGANSTIPALLAAWVPALISGFIGWATILYADNGS